jgi:CHAT domain
VFDWLIVVLLALMQTSDESLLRSARTAGDRLVERARVAGDEETAANVVYRLGILHLDPYTAVPGLDDRARGGGMPAPVDALRVAEAYLREAAETGSGGLRGMALEALALALSALKAHGEIVDRDEIVRLAREALPLLDGPDYEPYRLAAQTVLRDHGEDVEPDAVDGDADAPTPWGRRAAYEVARLRTGLSAGDDDEAAVANARLARSLVDPRDEGARIELFLAEGRLVADLAGARAPRGTGRRRLSAASRLRERAVRAGWNEQRTGRALLGLAYRCVGRSPDAGLAALGELRETCPTFVEENREVVDFVEAALHVDAGSNVASRKPEEALAHGSEAIALYAGLGLPQTALSVVPSLADIMAAHPSSVTVELLERLAPGLLSLQLALGEQAVQPTRVLCRDAIAALAESGGDTGVAIGLSQLAKGLRFGASLQRTEPYGLAEDVGAQELLSAVRRARSEAGPLEDDGPFDEEGLLTAWMAPRRTAEGETAAERLANLAGAFDEHVTAGLLDGGTADGPLLLRLPEVQRLIGPRTVLADLFLGMTPEHRAAAYALLVTNDEATLVVHARESVPGAGVFLGPGEFELWETWLRLVEQEVDTSSFAPGVASVRMLLQEDPFGRPVSARASEALASLYDALLGNGSALLSRYAEGGRDHLCVVPHGPLHFLPVHLLGRDGRCLADDWIVTYLANLRLLARERRTAQAGTAAGRAIGIGFVDHDELGLEPLPRAVPEARAVAGILGTEPLLDSAATKPVVEEALRTSRCLHVATHGRHSVRSPAFHSLVVFPDADGKHELHAYELVGLDLSELELVTMSACETALGRIDVGDNLRGLPACLVQAGVRTMVGTLWPAADEPCATFFPTFYGEYARSRSPLDAFAVAQRATRSEHPEHRDWGAFYLMGEWRGA